MKEIVQFQRGYYIQWAGQFENLQRAARRLLIVLPFTLLIIFVLIYMNTKSAVKTFIVLLAVPFSLLGDCALLYILGFNARPTSWVRLIPPAGCPAARSDATILPP